MRMYRVIFKDGTHGAWTKNYAEAKRSADFFHGRIESKVFEEKTK